MLLDAKATFNLRKDKKFEFDIIYRTHWTSKESLIWYSMNPFHS